MNTLRDIETELKASLYEDKEKLLKVARDNLANILELARNYKGMSMMEEALQEIEMLADKALRRLA